MALTKDKLEKWRLLGQFLAAQQETYNIFNGSVNNFTPVSELKNCTLCDDYKMFANLKGSSSLEQNFGIFLIICGLIAAAANILILVVVIRDKRYRNPLFLIITNFALIDLFKAFCAVYMGGVLVAAYFGSNPRHQIRTSKDGYFFVFKMLQISVFMMNFGNICSVFNLILATVNEFVYIRMSFLYRKVVTGCRVTAAIVITWILALLFALAKALHGGGAYRGTSRVMVPIVTRVEINETNEKNVSKFPYKDTKRPLFRQQGTTQPSDIYTLIILSCLLTCLLLVGVVYITLYITIRRSERFRTLARRAQGGSAGSSRSVLSRQCATKTKPASPGVRDSLVALDPECMDGKRLGSFRQTTFRLLTKGRRNSHRLFRRYKCIVVILIVCAVNFVYLSVYFSLQLLHMIHIKSGVSPERLRERYIINFLLRGLFVLHAALNPLIFFRIRQFRVSFLKLFGCNWIRGRFRGTFWEFRTNLCCWPLKCVRCSARMDNHSVSGAGDSIVDCWQYQHRIDVTRKKSLEQRNSQSSAKSRRIEIHETRV